MGGDLGWDWEDGPQNVKWGDSHASVPTNIFPTTIGCEAKYKVTKQRDIQ